ncbi:MAG TPA: histidine kinase dimerization/phosphoacceptor domain -containing protein [Geminicoccus sp.]|uniref:sensor histidine kinase n=1 Tax=Geminicoccus sp. TaxID=2024832 RepID=UPI002D0FE260|nr:histidine kinase dimerization/phosphoacceptor domain -containing protein [Geminicoccus sp.]HWL69234.1 histidine kinase dimerization/phosphoacceptor domain -containing protein [Geminicoccus sp.]
MQVSEFEQRLAQQALIAEFGRYALKNQDLGAILAEAVRIAADGLGTCFAKVLQWLPDENAFLLREGIGWRPGVVGNARIGGDLASPAGYAFKTCMPVISNHLAEEQRFRTPELMAEHGVRRAINVIIRGEGAAFGVLEADSRDPGTFSPHDINFLQALANTLGVAIDKEHARVEREALIEQKDLLLREIDHRVKNSLALVAGLLGMQERSACSAEAKAMLAAASARLMSIARIHEQLYRSADIASVAFDDYLAGLCDDVIASLSQPEQVTFTLEADRVVLPTDQAARLGLIAVELLTNALKHACRPGQRTRIRLDCRQEDGGLRLAISDNGPGLPEGFDPARSRGLGLRLVRSLVQQLDGTLETDRPKDGARFRVWVNETGSA